MTTHNQPSHHMGHLTVCRQVSAFPDRSDWEAISTGRPELYFMRTAAMIESCKSAHDRFLQVCPCLPFSPSCSQRSERRASLSFFVILFCLFGPNAHFLCTWCFSNSISILSPKSFLCSASVYSYGMRKSCGESWRRE